MLCLAGKFKQVLSVFSVHALDYTITLPKNAFELCFTKHRHCDYAGLLIFIVHTHLLEYELMLPKERAVFG